MNINRSNNKNSFTLKKKTRSRRYPTESMTDYANNLEFLKNTLAQAESLLHSQQEALVFTWTQIKHLISFKQDGAMSILNSRPLKLVDQLTYLGSNILSTERCPWCNGYRRRIWTRRYEFNSWTRLIAFHITLIPLGKVSIQLFSLQLWVNSRAD